VAQNTQDTVIQPNTIMVTATGEYDANPDTAVLACTISLVEKQFNNANARANRASDAVKTALTKNGVDLSAAQLGRLALQPIHDEKNNKRKITGYSASATMYIQITDFNKIGGLMESLAQIDDVDVSPVRYVIKNIEEAKLKAVQVAMEMARKTAMTAAQSGGRTLGEMTSTDVRYEVNGRPRTPQVGLDGSIAYSYKGYFTDSVTDFSVQTVGVNATVQVVFNLK